MTDEEKVVEKIRNNPSPGGKMIKKERVGKRPSTVIGIRAHTQRVRSVAATLSVVYLACLGLCFWVFASSEKPVAVPVKAPTYEESFDRVMPESGDYYCTKLYLNNELVRHCLDLDRAPNVPEQLPLHNTSETGRDL